MAEVRAQFFVREAPSEAAGKKRKDAAVSPSSFPARSVVAAAALAASQVGLVALAVA